MNKNLQVEILQTTLEYKFQSNSNLPIMYYFKKILEIKPEYVRANFIKCVHKRACGKIGNV